MPKPSTKQIFRVTFWNQNQIYELYVNHIYQSDLYGFIEVEEYQFGERSGMILNPAEERLKNEFSGVKRSYIPMHTIIRIDEVEKQQSLGKITEYKGEKVTPITFPTPIAGLRPKPSADA
jgi:hypothetical protein